MKHHNKLGTALAILFVLVCIFALGTSVFADRSEAVEIDSYYSGGAQSFGTVEYYCREGLASSADAELLLHVYDRIVSGIAECSNKIEFDTSKYTISVDHLRIAMKAYRNDYAHHFWIGNSYTPFGTSPQNITYVVPTYLMTGDELTQAKAEFEAAADAVLEGITPEMSEFERELLIHDRLADIIYYPKMDVDYDPNAPGNAHNAYGALVEGRAVCEGYAEALQYLLHRVGIQSALVLGESNGVGHEWNLVKIDGKYYYVDLTWNDPFTATENYPTDVTDGDPTIYYAYLNISTEMLLQDHVLDATEGYSLPVCDSLDAFYYKKMGRYLTSFSVDGIAELLNNEDLTMNVFVASPNTVNDLIEWLTANNNANLLSVINKLGLKNGVSYGYRYYGREFTFYMICAHRSPTMQKAASPTCTADGNSVYYICSCGKWFADYAATNEITDKSTVVIPALDHNWAQKTQNATYLKKQASDCRYYNEYWYGCNRSNCTAISSEEYYTGTTKGAHDYSTLWTTSTTMHWHECKYCDSKSDSAAHKYNALLPTEYDDKYCTECLYVAAAALGHTHSLTKVPAVPASCTEDGNVLYYTCHCDKWFADEAATTLITDKTTVVIKASGHDYSEVLMNGAHLHTAATSCLEYYKYWYNCKNEGCDANAKNDAEATDKYYVSAKSGNHVTTKVAAEPESCTEQGNIEYYTCICGRWFTTSSASNEITDKTSVNVAEKGHDYTEKIKDAAHLCANGVDCRYADIYWYDCSRCDANAKDDAEATSSCYESTDKGDHVYKSEWNQGNANGHWHDCKYCTAHTVAEGHTGDIPAATEERAKLCQTCGYVMQAKLNHVHAPTKVAADPASCTESGNIEYYVCSCGKWFTTAAATTEITDKTSVNVAKKGHDYTEVKTDAAHFRSKGSDCRYVDSYWYDCSRCDANAKDDAEATTRYYSGTQKGDHVYTTEWNKGDANGHWHDCKYCSAHTVAEGHIADIPAPTEEQDQLCQTCGYVIKVKLNHVHSLTRVGAEPVSCTEDGNVEYYVCTCDKWFTTASATTEITDKDSVKIKSEGHKWTEKCEDTAHLKTEATDCRYCNDYWYDCANCDAISSTVSFSGNTHGSHVFKEEWGEGDINGNWHDCKYCTAHDTPVSHVPNIENATENEAKVCNNCGYIIEPTLSHTHEAATEWQSDAESHWHACTGCNAQKLDVAVHSDTNADGKCDVCQHAVSVTETDKDTRNSESTVDKLLAFIKDNLAIVFIALGGTVILVAGICFMLKKKK